MTCTRRFTIKGRVQGVFFRESTRRVAESLGISGHAINLRDGDVEVLACGKPEDLDALASWLRDGPRMAEVSEVIAQDIGDMRTDGFRTG